MHIVTNEQLVNTCNAIINSLKSISSGYQTQYATLDRMDSDTASGGIRHWGSWDVAEDDDYGDEDNDHEVLIDKWSLKLADFHDETKKKYPNLEIGIWQGEKNWIEVYVSRK